MDQEQDVGPWPELPCGHQVVDPNQVHYCDYISLETLMQLLKPHAAGSRPREIAHHDEYQFLTVHQMCEISFQMHLHVLKTLIEDIDQERYEHARHMFHRMTRQTVLHQSILEMLFTMEKEDFAQFRPGLLPASGAESIAYREIEILSGVHAESAYASFHKRVITFRETLDRALVRDGEGQKSRWWLDHFENLMKAPSLASVFDNALARYKLRPQHLFDPDPDETRDQLQKLAHKFFEYEVAFGDLRWRHMLLAAHQIGGKSGSQTEGVSYLVAVAKTVRFHPALFALMRTPHLTDPPPWDK